MCIKNKQRKNWKSCILEKNKTFSNTKKVIEFSFQIPILNTGNNKKKEFPHTYPTHCEFEFEFSKKEI
jgi:hypothetical protein